MTAPLDRSSFFKLILLVNLTAKPFARRWEATQGITLTEWRVMLSLAQHPGATANAIGDMLGLDKMAISRAVRGLERRGRLDRPANRRNVGLSLSEAGMALFETIAPSAREREDLLMGALSPADRMAFDTLLDRLIMRAREMPGD